MGRQGKSALPTLGYCAKCLLPLAQEVEPEPLLLATIRAAAGEPKAEKARTVPGKMKPETQAGETSVEPERHGPTGPRKESRSEKKQQPKRKKGNYESNPGR